MMGPAEEKHPKSVITLATGREIRLTHLYRQLTYLGFMEGTHTRDLAIREYRAIARNAMDRVKTYEGQTRPVLLRPLVWHWPERRWLPWDLPRDPDPWPGWLQQMLPAAATVATFVSGPKRGDEDSDGSALTILWFQNDPHLFLEAQPRAELDRLDWDRLAVGWGW